MDYGNYADKPSAYPTESKVEKEKKDSNKESEPIASEISQKIFDGMNISTPKEAIQDRTVAHLKKTQGSTPEAKTHEIGIPVLINSDFIDEEQDSSSPASTSSKYDDMTEEELEEALNDPEITEEEIDQIMARLEELSTNLTEENLNLTEENANMTEENVNMTEKNIEVEQNNTEIDKQDSTINQQTTQVDSQKIEKDQKNIGLQKTQDIKLEQTDQKTGLVKKLEVKKSQKVKENRLITEKWNVHQAYALVNGALKKMSGVADPHKVKNIVSFDVKTGTLSVSPEDAKKYQLGQKIQVEDEHGNKQEIEITKMNVLTKEESAEFKKSFIDYHVSLQPAQAQKRETKESGMAGPNLQVDDERDTSSTPGEEKLKAAHKRPHQYFFPPAGDLGPIGPSTKEFNEKRLRDLTEFLEQKFEKIMSQLKSELIINEAIKANDLSLAIQASDIESSAIQKTAQSKLDAEYLNLIRELHQARGPSIPLATLVHFRKLEIIFQQVTRMIPSEINPHTSKLLVDTVALKNEVMALIKDVITVTGSAQRTTTGSDGKISAS